MKRKYFLLLFIILIFYPIRCYGQDNLTFTINGVSFNMIFVEGGTFIMGCTPEQGNCFPEERPTHSVTLSDFFIGEFEVTQKLWNVVMGTTVRQQCNLTHTGLGTIRQLNIEWTPKSHPDPDIPKYIYYETPFPLNGEGNNYPIYYINYNECELFCNRLTQLLADVLPEGYRFRIPTEAQWEYAARGGKKSKNYRFSGSDIIDEIAWFNTNSEITTQEVGKKFKNELGIYDMSGNVWEWCRDRYSENYYRSSPSVNPKGPDKGNKYVLRGGSWDYEDWACRVAMRMQAGIVECAANYGFRLCLEPPPKLTGSGFFGYTGSFSASRLASNKNLTFKVNNEKLEMVFVEGGTFSMGCNAESKNGDTIEKPSHDVKLSNFYMSKIEITQKLWYDVMETTLRKQRDSANIEWDIYGEGDHYPIYYVSYEECKAFCEKLNRLLYTQLPEGYKFSLPSEAQWEYAARGGNKSKEYIYSGSNNIGKVAWWAENCGTETRKVGYKMKNELGIYDMSGNVWEWCSDWFEADYYSYGSATNPQGPLSGTQRVLRGGSWNLSAWHSRSTTRYFYEPESRSANVGFRIVLMPAKDLFDLKSVKNAIKERSYQLSSANNRNFKIEDLYFEMVFVKGGTFIMGCTSDPKNCLESEEPTRSVTLSDFYMGKYQVTQQLWTKVMSTTLQQQRNILNPTLPLYGEGDYYPMYFINYTECQEFCKKLNQLLSKQLPEGYKFSLPTEAQWEYAARGGKKSKNYTYSGDENIRKIAWYLDNSTQTHEIGMKNKNELGIYDMSGNVMEWCSDWIDFYEYSTSSDPTGPIYGHYRVLRGGSWRNIDKDCRVSSRYARPPNERMSSCGLRLALTKTE